MTGGGIYIAPSKNITMPASDSLSGLLLIFTALSGELPPSQVVRLPGSDYYKKNVVNDMKKKKLLRTYFSDHLRGLRLTSTGKKLLLDHDPDRYQTIFSGERATNAPKYSLSDRLRLHRMAEVLVTMHNADVLSFPWEKPAIFQQVPLSPQPVIIDPTYYSSREMKEIGDQAIKIRNCRSTGVLFSANDIFAVYNTGSSRIKWDHFTEERLKALVQQELCQKRLSGQFKNAPLKAIVFGDGMKPLEKLMLYANSGKAQSDIVLNGTFEQFHYLSSDRRGEIILQLLCYPELKISLDKILLEDLSEHIPNFPIEHDAMDEKGSPVLFAYTCDMPRIRRFDNALGVHERTGTLICFDFQLEVLSHLCGPRVTFQSIDFEAFERSIQKDVL